ncbi:MAG: thioredoxin domain-containing protein [Gaiellaceae bacterium]
MNRLASETSPYLLQHAANPVDWYPWGEEALERARREDKPILLSVGYAACHWCHVMAHESFEDVAVAGLMNEHFVNVKVDREERPDVDALYMDAVVAMTGSGGWPLTAFLTPGGAPFFGGTYFPPEPRHGLPSFGQLLRTLAQAWQTQRADLLRSGERLVQALRETSELARGREPLQPALLEQALEALAAGFDPAWGGFGSAPKFPPAPVVELLLRLSRSLDDERARSMAGATLDGMALGGMHDLVGGGFHRYSVDQRWLVPHFEKMLYDNALLARAYLHGWLVLGKEVHRLVAERTIEAMLRELRLPEGAFASSLDADTDGVEGLTYTWTGEEVAAALSFERSELLQPFEGGRFVLRGALSDTERERLLAARLERPQPARDDKALASWNGLALAALAEGARLLGRDDWRQAALALAEFLLGPLSDGRGRLLRSFRAGKAKQDGFLDDYANVAAGLIELHLASGELRWLGEARRLAVLALELFRDEERGGFFLAPRDGESLVARSKELQDNPMPSGNAMLADVLLRLSRIYGEEELKAAAAGAMGLLGSSMARVPSAFGHMLCVLDLHLSKSREIAIVGDREAPVAREALRRYEPQAVLAISAGRGDEAAQRVPLLAGKDLVRGRTAVYVCERFACQAPVTDPAALP